VIKSRKKISGGQAAIQSLKKKKLNMFLALLVQPQWKCLMPFIMKKDKFIV